MPLTTCGRCACDFIILAPYRKRTKRYRCHCGRIYWLPQPAEFKLLSNNPYGPQCVTPEDHRRWLEGY